LVDLKHVLHLHVRAGNSFENHPVRGYVQMQDLMALGYPRRMSPLVFERLVFSGQIAIYKCRDLKEDE
jgi:hypothetical protein